MSLATIKAAAAEQKGTYIEVRADDLAEALKDNKDCAELAAHVSERLARNPDAVMQVHRDVHLGKLLGVPSNSTAVKQKLET